MRMMVFTVVWSYVFYYSIAISKLTTRRADYMHSIWSVFNSNLAANTEVAARPLANVRANK